MTSDSIVRKVFLIALFAICVLQTACSRGMIDSDLVAQDEVTGSNNIYRSYELAADEQRRGTVFSAVFSVKDSWGTYVRLTPPSKLLVNGRPAKDTSVIDRQDGGELAAFYAGFIFPLFWIYMGDQSQASYSAIIRKAQGSVIVDWTDHHGQLIRDRLQMPTFTASAPSKLGSGQDLVLTLDGGGNYDRISVQVSPDSSSGQPATVVSQSFDAGTSLRISASQLDALPRGPVTIALEASSEENLDSQGSAGGSATMIYKKKPLKLNLEH